MSLGDAWKLAVASPGDQLQVDAVEVSALRLLTTQNVPEILKPLWITQRYWLRLKKKPTGGDSSTAGGVA